MQLRVVTDQPWDVPADVLAVPILGKDPAFQGPLGELDRRSGGELRSLAAFGELRGKRFSSAIAPGGDGPNWTYPSCGTEPATAKAARDAADRLFRGVVAASSVVGGE